uniref:Secreted protein n=1 Tax=Parascaris univalens TaxID=6257 RepID=A0A915CBM1_PARUN
MREMVVDVGSARFTSQKRMYNTFCCHSFMQTTNSGLLSVGERCV